MLYIIAFVTFIVGLLVGGFLFSDSKSRPLLSVSGCDNCLARNEIAGIFASIVVQHLPNLIPDIIFETEKTIVFKHPRPKHRIHYMFVPKKDIKNIGELTDEDSEYITDLLSTIVTIIHKLETKNYKLWTNGPDKQDVTYLHFHFGAD